MPTCWQKPAVEAVENGDIQFVPKQYENMYFSWMRDIQDWCISRQLWWGHRIRHGMTKRVYVYVGRNEDEVRKENNLGADVALHVRMKTFSTPGSPPRCGPSPRSAGRKTPTHCASSATSVMVSGFDIIFFWIAHA